MVKGSPSTSPSTLEGDGELQINEAHALAEDFFATEDLHPDLVPYISESENWKMLHHPLVISVPYIPHSNKHTNGLYAYKKERLKKALSEKDWHSYVFIHERPYRINALKEVLFDFSLFGHKESWELISSVWIDSENIYQYIDDWSDIWASDDIQNDERYSIIMDDEERSTLESLPNQIEIYRGVSYRASADGMSWTTDKEKAIWFAKRFALNKSPLLVTGKIFKEDVLAYFRGRNESEIVAFPQSVKIEGIKKI